MKVKGVLKLTAISFFLMFGCGIEVGNPHVPAEQDKSGTVNVTVGQDYDEEYNELGLAFSSVEFIDDAGNSQTIESEYPEQMISLAGDGTSEVTGLTLVNSGGASTETIFIREKALPVGNYSKIRLKINASAQNYASKDGKRYPLSLQESEFIEMDYKLKVDESGDYEIYVQPSLSESLKLEGDKILYKPRFFAAKREALTKLTGSLKTPGLNGNICIDREVGGKGRVLNNVLGRFSAVEKEKNSKILERLSNRTPILDKFNKVQVAKVCGLLSIKAKVVNSKFSFLFKLPPGKIELKFIDDQNQAYSVKQMLTLEEGKPLNSENLELEKIK